MAHLSVVIPVYKAEGCIEELERRLKSSIETFTNDYEILLIDDCSPDGSWAKIQELARNNKKVRGIRFTRNFGQHQGITAGLDMCDGDYVIVMDCDLQDPPEWIPKLYQKIKEDNVDIVITRRQGRKDSFFKKLVNKIYYKVFSFLVGTKYDSSIGNFRIVKRPVVDSFKQMRERLRFFAVLVDSMGYPSSYLDVEHASRFSGVSSYRLSTLLRLAVSGLVAYSNKPLVWSIGVGFVFAFIAFIAAIYLIFLALFQGVQVAGWASLIVSMYFLFGVLMMNVGIVGIYLSNVFDQVKGRPLYIVHKTINVP